MLIGSSSCRFCGCIKAILMLLNPNAENEVLFGMLDATIYCSGGKYDTERRGKRMVSANGRDKVQRRH